jgi:hypothetical protein
MLKMTALGCAVLSLIAVAGCAQNTAQQPPQAPVTNATPPPLPPDPALGPHAQPAAAFTASPSREILTRPR